MTISTVQAKLASMIAIGAGSFVVGVAPACFVSRAQELQQRLLLSCTLCFGGGVLLATSILHMLPETRESMPTHAELVFACGFLFLYLVDESVHYFWNDADRGSDSQHRESRNWVAGHQANRCGSHSHQVDYSPSARTIRHVSVSEVNPKSPYQSNYSENGTDGNWKSTTYGALQYAPSAPTPFCNEDATFLCHGSHSEPSADSSTSLVGLLLALTVHSVLEGLAIGLQKATSEVFLLAGAVASHKFVVSFCLGLELAGVSNSLFRLILAIFTFSAGSAAGIGVGMLTLRVNKSWMKTILPVLQGLAGGTLLYATVSEILPRERARWHRSSRRFAGVLQFFSVILGFVLIFLLNSYVGT